jgi:glycosyltransferase involved in cell wall biosynthesis
MRFLFLINIPVSARPAGIQQSIRVCHQLAKSGEIVHAHICSKPFRNQNELLSFFGLSHVESLQWHFFPHPFRNIQIRLFHRMWGYLFFLVQLLKLIMTNQRSHYDFFFTRGNYFPAGFIFLKRFFNFRIIYELHEISYLNNVQEEDLLKKNKFIDTEKYSYLHADSVIVISNTLKDLAERKWGKVQYITVIPSGCILFDSNVLPSHHLLKRIYFVGNFYLLSGLDYLIKALLLLPDCTLTVVGGGGIESVDYKRVSALVAQLGIQDRVEFRGFVQPHKLPEIYAEAGVLVMPYTRHIRSKYFSSPLKLFEYMCARRPIIASNLPTIREILYDHCNALLVQPENPTAIASAVTSLRSDPALAIQLGEQAYLDVRQYSMEKKCNATKTFLNGAVV